jgi:AraC-like DNA-binding protein
MSFEKMAFKFDLSESRMRALFKSKVGVPPTQYVIKVKMEEAAKRLRDSYERVNKIATALGFDSNSYFARS